MEKERQCRKAWNNQGSMPARGVLDVGKNVGRYIERSMSRNGLTSIQSRILGHIFMQQKQGKMVLQREIEDYFRIRRSSVTSVLQHLEQKGYITRESVPGDGRLKQLVLTESGEKLQKCSLNVLNQVEKTYRNLFTEDELEFFFECLHKMDDATLKLLNEEETND